MRRKILTAFLAGSAAICISFGFAACGPAGESSDFEDVPGNVEDFDASGDPDYVGDPTQNLGLVFEQNADNTYTVKGFKPETEAKRDLAIPSSYNKQPVTAIADNAFSGEDDIVSVSIGENVKTVGSNAFSSCSNIMSVRIAASVETLGEQAFAKCKGLKAVIFADNSSLSKISAHAFESCEGLSKFTIPENVTEIAASAFYQCSGLVTVEMFENVKIIGNGAFDSCKKLSNLTIGGGVTTIAAQAFAYCTALTEVIIPDSVNEIGLGAFEHCDNIQKITLPFVGASKELAKLPSEEEGEDGSAPEEGAPEEEEAEKTHLGYIFGALSHYENDQRSYEYVPKKLTYVKVTGGERIAAYALAYCYNLETIILADSIQVLDDDAFGQCEKVQTLVLGSGLQEIREALFGLRSYSASDPSTLPLNIYYTGTAETWDSIIIDQTQSTPNVIPNNLIINAAKYYYSETVQDAEHWRYVNGMPKVYG